MATISNAEFFRRLRQQRGTTSYSFNVDEFQGDDELSYSAYVDSVMNNRMLENEEERINKELIARSNELTQSIPNNRPETVDNVIANAQNETNAYTRTINTVNEVALELVKGMWGFIEGLGDAIITGIGAVGSWFGADTEWADNAVAYDWASRATRATYNISPLALLSGDMFENNPNRWDFSDEGMEEFEQGLYTDSWLYEAPSVVHDTLNSVAEGIGQQIPTIALAVLTGGGSTGASLLSQAGTKLLSTSLMGASAVGSSSQALLQEDENRTVGDIALYALVSGAVEMGTEYMLEPLQYLGDMFPTSKVAQSISKAFPNFTAGVSTNASGSIVKNLFGTMVEEGIEEVASDLVDPAMRALFLDHTSIGESYKNNLKGEDLLNSFVVGALSAGVLGGGSVIVNTYRSGGINNYRAILGVQELQDLQARGQDLINRGLAYQVNEQTGETELTPIAQNLINRMVNVKERINSNVERMNETQKIKYLTAITNKSYAEIVQNAKSNVEQLENQYNQILQNIDELIVQTNNNLSLSPSERQTRINNLEKNKETARFLNENLVKRAREIVNNQEENAIKQAIKIVNQSYEETINLIKDAGETQEYSKYKNNLKKDLQKYARDLTVANQERIRKDLENINATLNTYLKSATTTEQKYNVFKNLIDFNQALNLMAYNKDILTNDFLNDYINDYIENTKNKTIKDVLIEYQASKLFERINVNTRLVLMEENFFKVGEKGRYDATQNVIYLNKKYANEYSRTFAHEFVGHLIYDRVGKKEINKYVNKIMRTEWFSTIKESFEVNYNFSGLEYSELNETQKELYNSELFARFIEEKFDNPMLLEVITEPNFFKRQVLKVHSLIEKVKLDNKFVNNVKRVMERFKTATDYVASETRSSIEDLSEKETTLLNKIKDYLTKNNIYLKENGNEILADLVREKDDSYVGELLSNIKNDEVYNKVYKKILDMVGIKVQERVNTKEQVLTEQQQKVIDVFKTSQNETVAIDSVEIDEIDPANKLADNIATAIFRLNDDYEDGDIDISTLEDVVQQLDNLKNNLTDDNIYGALQVYALLRNGLEDYGETLQFNEDFLEDNPTINEKIKSYINYFDNLIGEEVSEVQVQEEVENEDENLDIDAITNLANGIVSRMEKKEPLSLKEFQDLKDNIETIEPLTKGVNLERLNERLKTIGVPNLTSLFSKFKERAYLDGFEFNFKLSFKEEVEDLKVVEPDTETEDQAIFEVEPQEESLTDYLENQKIKKARGRPSKKPKLTATTAVKKLIEPHNKLKELIFSREWSETNTKLNEIDKKIQDYNADSNARANKDLEITSEEEQYVKDFVDNAITELKELSSYYRSSLDEVFKINKNTGDVLGTKINLSVENMKKLVRAFSHFYLDISGRYEKPIFSTIARATTYNRTTEFNENAVESSDSIVHPNDAFIDEIKPKIEELTTSYIYLVQAFTPVKKMDLALTETDAYGRASAFAYEQGVKNANGYKIIPYLTSELQARTKTFKTLDTFEEVYNKKYLNRGNNEAFEVIKGNEEDAFLPVNVLKTEFMRVWDDEDNVDRYFKLEGGYNYESNNHRYYFGRYTDAVGNTNDFGFTYRTFSRPNALNDKYTMIIDGMFSVGNNVESLARAIGKYVQSNVIGTRTSNRRFGSAILQFSVNQLDAIEIAEVLKEYDIYPLYTVGEQRSEYRGKYGKSVKDQYAKQTYIFGFLPNLSGKYDTIANSKDEKLKYPIGNVYQLVNFDKEQLNKMLNRATTLSVRYVENYIEATIEESRRQGELQEAIKTLHFNKALVDKINKHEYLTPEEQDIVYSGITEANVEEKKKPRKRKKRITSEDVDKAIAKRQQRAERDNLKDINMFMQRLLKAYSKKKSTTFDLIQATKRDLNNIQEIRKRNEALTDKVIKEIDGKEQIIVDNMMLVIDGDGNFASYLMSLKGEDYVPSLEDNYYLNNNELFESSLIYGTDILNFNTGKLVYDTDFDEYTYYIGEKDTIENRRKEIKRLINLKTQKLKNRDLSKNDTIDLSEPPKAINQEGKVATIEEIKEDKKQKTKKTLTDYQILITNKQAGLENALVRDFNLTRREAGEWAYKIRSANNVGNLRVSNGQLVFNQENGTYERTTSSLKDANNLVNELVDDTYNQLKGKKDKGLAKKTLLDRFIGKEKIERDEVLKVVLNDLYRHAYDQMQIDSNTFAANKLVRLIYDFESLLKQYKKKIGEISVEDAFKNTLAYIKKFKVKGTNYYNPLNRNELENVVDQDFDNFSQNDFWSTLRYDIKQKLQNYFKRVKQTYDIQTVYGRSILKQDLFKLGAYNDFKEYFVNTQTNLNELEITVEKMLSESLGSEVNYEEFTNIITELEKNEKIVLYKWAHSSNPNEVARYNVYKNVKSQLLNRLVEPSYERLRTDMNDIESELGTDYVNNFLGIVRENINATVDRLVQHGILTPTDVSYMRNAFPNYVPLPREKISFASDIGASGKSVKTVVRNRKGSNLTIQALMNSTADFMRNAEVVMARNDLFRHLFEIGVIDNQSEDIIVNAEDYEKVRITDTNILNKVAETITDADTDANKIKFVIVGADAKKSYYTATMSDRVAVAFSDINAYGIKALNKFGELLRTSSFVNFFRNVVTEWNPFFIFRNISRDLQDALLTTRNNSAQFAVEYINSIRLIRQGDPVWNLFIQNAGYSSSFIASNGSKKLLDYLTTLDRNERPKWNNIVSKLNLYAEILPRFTEFRLSYSKYLLTDNFDNETALRKALYDSANITTDFSRGGVVSKAFNRTLVPFLNAQIQGFCKAYNFVVQPRALKDWVSLLFKLLLLGILPELLQQLIYGDDEDYEALPDYTKEQYYLLKVGNGQFIRIPKGRILGTIQSFLINFNSAITQEKDIDEALATWWDTATSNLSPIGESGIRTIFAPIEDVNKNITWYGQNIDKQSDLNKAPSERYDGDTSEIAKFIGKIFNYSPKRINYLLEQYTGVLGDILLPLTTSGDVGSVLMNFVNSNMTIDAVANNKYRGQFYDYRQELLYRRSTGDEIARELYRYLDRCLNEIEELENQVDTLTDDAEIYTLYLTIREAYKTAIENAKALEPYLENINLTDSEDDDFAITEAYRQAFGSEMALKYYDKNVYERSQRANELGISYDDFYIMYFEVRGCDSKVEAVRVIEQFIKNDLKYAVMKLLGIALSEREKSIANRYLNA